MQSIYSLPGAIWGKEDSDEGEVVSGLIVCWARDIDEVPAWAERRLHHSPIPLEVPVQRFDRVRISTFAAHMPTQSAPDFEAWIVSAWEVSHEVWHIDFVPYDWNLMERLSYCSMRVRLAHDAARGFGRSVLRVGRLLSIPFLQWRSLLGQDVRFAQDILIKSALYTDAPPSLVVDAFLDIVEVIEERSLQKSRGGFG